MLNNPNSVRNNETLMAEIKHELTSSGVRINEYTNSGVRLLEPNSGCSFIKVHDGTSEKKLIETELA